jgi:hypothetical protein
MFLPNKDMVTVFEHITEAYISNPLEYKFENLTFN